MRSLWLNDMFYMDQNVYPIVNQFMIGDALLISPQIEQGKSTITAYFPSSARWYDWFSGIELMTKGEITINTPLPVKGGTTQILPIHICGGNIIPLQDLNGTLTTKQQSVKPYQLLVALNADNGANGKMYIDDGISIDSVVSDKYTMITFNIASSSGKYTLKITL